ncbi:hypothetical protein BD410DRAFT_843491 [Rickenella mellea]|uniref:Uncharacterized protein n=1 Tax=Rickenella mellea TaxID=50990 RepID=A0A4Y7PRT1_9AGAM|nr:hypothetical protein BD410DRAFT_843491 [Rickenella mellea]
MPPGPPTKFSSLQEAWIQNHVPEYLEKFRNSKPHADRNWKKLQWDLFFQEFSDELNASDEPTGDWRDRFNRKFTNAKHRTPKGSNKRVGSPQPSPVVQWPQEHTADTARELWVATVKDDVNAEVTQARSSAGIDHRQHAGMYQAALKKRWESLTELEREAWTEKAVALRDAEERWDDPQLFLNQKTLAKITTRTFQGMIGPGPHRVGNAAFHLLFSYRDSDDLLQTGCVTVAPQLPEPFHKVLPNYELVVVKPWQDYCEMNIPRVHENVECTMLKRNEANMPVLPSINEEKSTIADLRAILKAYIDALWYAGWPKSDDMPEPPWDDIVAHPADYLDVSTLSPGLTVKNPDTMDSALVLSLLKEIQHAQRNTPPCYPISFRSRQSIQDALTARQNGRNEITVPRTPKQRATRRVVLDDEAESDSDTSRLVPVQSSTALSNDTTNDAESPTFTPSRASSHAGIVERTNVQSISIVGMDTPRREHLNGADHTPPSGTLTSELDQDNTPRVQPAQTLPDAGNDRTSQISAKSADSVVVVVADGDPGDGKEHSAKEGTHKVPTRVKKGRKAKKVLTSSAAETDAVPSDKSTSGKQKRSNNSAEEEPPNTDK